MLNMRRKKFTALSLAALAWCVLAPAANAQQSEQRALQDYYLEEVQSNGSLYKTSPVTHIVPFAKEITFALEAKHIDLTLDGTGLATSRNSPRNDSEINMTGYTVTPYVAISLKRVGLGFSAEAGQRSYTYKDGSSSQNQKADLNYRAIGIYAYLLPFDNSPNWLTASVVLGAKSFNATHRNTQMESGSIRESDYTKYRYNTISYLGGMLLDFHFMKRFSIVPWLDDTYTDISAANDAAKSENRFQGSNAYYLTQEAPFFWRARPQAEYGIDLVCRFDLLSVHLGDFLAPLAYQTDSSVIKNHSVQLSISAEMKGD